MGGFEENTSYVIFGMCNSVKTCMYVCMYEGRATSGHCTATITDLLCFPFRLTRYQSRTSNELQDPIYGGVIILTWFHNKLAQVTKTSQSHRTCVADSSSSRHLSHMGSSVNPSLKRCPFRWQCPVNSPTIYLNWFLLSFNRSFDLLAEGPTVRTLSRLRHWWDLLHSNGKCEQI
jgi:hypothetical protein